MKPVKCTDIKAFTNTHYHIASDSGFVEKADSYEEVSLVYVYVVFIYLYVYNIYTVYICVCVYARVSVYV